jgi:hypothetical protein
MAVRQPESYAAADGQHRYRNERGDDCLASSAWRRGHENIPRPGVPVTLITPIGASVALIDVPVALIDVPVALIDVPVALIDVPVSLTGGRRLEAFWRSATVTAARHKEVIERVVFGSTAGRLLARHSTWLLWRVLTAVGRIVSGCRVSMVAGDSRRLRTGWWLGGRTAAAHRFRERSLGVHRFRERSAASGAEPRLSAPWPSACSAEPHGPSPVTDTDLTTFQYSVVLCRRIPGLASGRL